LLVTADGGIFFLFFAKSSAPHLAAQQDRPPFAEIVDILNEIEACDEVLE
jgi:hypothetical protein